jgi:hypothetical protein
LIRFVFHFNFIMWSSVNMLQLLFDVSHNILSYTLQKWNIYQQWFMMRLKQWDENEKMIVKYINDQRFILVIVSSTKEIIHVLQWIMPIVLSVFTQYHPYVWVIKTIKMLHYTCTYSMNHMIDHLGTLFTRCNEIVAKWEKEERWKM